MPRTTVVIAMLLAELSITGFAQEARPAELVLTTRNDLEQTHLPHEMYLPTAPLRQAFDLVLIAARRPGGAVFSYGCEEPAQTLLSIPSTYSLASAFDLLTAAYPTHYWTVRDGVVNLLPKLNLPAILDAHVERLAWDTTDPAIVSVGRVFGLSAIKHRLAELGFTGDVDVTGLQETPRVVDGVPQKPKGRGWKIENLTLLTALNRVAASYGVFRWWYEERTCGTDKTYRVGAR